MRQDNQPILRELQNPSRKIILLPVVAVILVVLAGIGTGWFLSGGTLLKKGMTSQSAPGVKEGKNEAGVSDESTFSDTAEGTLQKGGIEGDGTHTLIRDGGISKHVALTSTVIDLDSFAGKKVQVWGQTLTAQKAPWLMDVGKIKIID